MEMHGVRRWRGREGEGRRERKGGRGREGEGGTEGEGGRERDGGRGREGEGGRGGEREAPLSILASTVCTIPNKVYLNTTDCGAA